MYEVFNRTDAPYRTVCYIECEWSDGSSTRGSGVVVGLNDVLTAAHVVYDATRGGYATSVVITPAADVDAWGSVISQPYGQFTGQFTLAVRTGNWDADGDGLLTQAEAQYDLALIGLDSEIGDYVGWSGWWATSSDIYGTMVGYPASETGMMAEYVYGDASAYYGVFNIDSRLGAGASGGPLFYTDENGSYVVGVLSSGNNSSSTYAGLFGPGNQAWFESALSYNDYLIGGGGGGGGGDGGGGGGTVDDYAASTSTTGRVSAGGSATGTVEELGDEDWFRIELSAGTYRFDLVGGSLEDPYLTLYSASGVELYSNDDIELAVQLDSSLTVTLGAGTYYVGASSYWDSDYFPDPGTYTLSVTQQGAYNGTSANDNFTGTSASESFQGNGGNDTMNGMGGTDTVYFRNDREDYLLGRSSGAITVFDLQGLDGTDRLTNMERLVFADITVNLTIGATSETISASNLKLLQELYVAFFNRVPDADGLGYWIDQFRGGMSIDSIANAFYSAALAFPSETGYSSSMSNADFVNIVYRNVLGREDGADVGGLAHWTGLLASGAATRGSLVTTILGSAHSFKGDATWGWVADLLDNKAAVAQLFAVEMGLNYNTASASITHGIEIAGAVTPYGISSALALIGVADGFSTLG